MTKCLRFGWDIMFWTQTVLVFSNNTRNFCLQKVCLGTLMCIDEVRERNMPAFILTWTICCCQQTDSSHVTVTLLKNKCHFTQTTVLWILFFARACLCVSVCLHQGSNLVDVGQLFALNEIQKRLKKNVWWCLWGGISPYYWAKFLIPYEQFAKLARC